MTDIEQKALELVNEVLESCGGISKLPQIDRYNHYARALCRAIERHEAFRKEVSDAVEDTKFMVETHCDTEALALVSNRLNRFIIAKPDPLEKLLQSIAITLDANDLREALDEAGLEIREKGNG